MVEDLGAEACVAESPVPRVGARAEGDDLVGGGGGGAEEGEKEAVDGFGADVCACQLSVS
jgi:hypothetical protein